MVKKREKVVSVIHSHVHLLESSAVLQIALFPLDSPFFYFTSRVLDVLDVLDLITPTVSFNYLFAFITFHIE